MGSRKSFGCSTKATHLSLSLAGYISDKSYEVRARATKFHGYSDSRVADAPHLVFVALVSGLGAGSFPTMTKSASSHVNGGFWRRSVLRSSRSTSRDDVRRSSRRWSHVTFIGRSTALCVNLSNRRRAPRRTTSSMAGDALAVTRLRVLCEGVRLRISSVIGATVDPLQVSAHASPTTRIGPGLPRDVPSATGC